MKRTKILYWVFTGLFAALMLATTIPDIVMSEDAVKFMMEGSAEQPGLGYPRYFIPFIGWAKLLGIIAILVPGYPRLKEWAYAGLFFDLIGALYSQIAVAGGFKAPMLIMLVWFVFGILSYIYYHKKLKLQS